MIIVPTRLETPESLIVLLLILLALAPLAVYVVFWCLKRLAPKFVIPTPTHQPFFTTTTGSLGSYLNVTPIQPAKVELALMPLVTVLAMTAFLVVFIVLGVYAIYSDHKERRDSGHIK